MNKRKITFIFKLQYFQVEIYSFHSQKYHSLIEKLYAELYLNIRSWSDILITDNSFLHKQ